MSKWITIDVIVVGFGALTATGGLWAPSLVELATDNKDDVDVVTTGIQIVLTVLGLIVAVLAYFRMGKGVDTGSVTADRGGVAIGGDADGSTISTEGAVAARGDFSSGVTVTGREA